MSVIGSRLEINVSLDFKTDFGNLGSFVKKHGVPAVVVPPELVGPTILDRVRSQSVFKIICSVDFPAGKLYALEKIRTLVGQTLQVDGYDIQLSPYRNESEAINELRALHEFFHRGIDPSKEIRWTLGLDTASRESMQRAFKYMLKFPPQFVRTNVNYNAQLPAEQHMDEIKFIRNSVGFPIKICGGITHDIIKTVGGRAARFDVSLSQAQRIVDTIENEARQQKRLKNEAVSKSRATAATPKTEVAPTPKTSFVIPTPKQPNGITPINGSIGQEVQFADDSKRG